MLLAIEIVFYNILKSYKQFAESMKETLEEVSIIGLKSD